ncbi:asparagine synthase (glutamine-hydrolyzing) [Streptomyces sp. RKAG337]|uniref:asparagine synthase (glutamine-hydrolyzing) n=1 Tax=Streptomyces sp. RKAG337 TaxID=2893404 RepID=UPI002033E800|nr:asparagine synthase (glutamine-hydrolyzing) [Streptomyces sp. RKAG337]MCM2424489.1 asparagine synthase (glutamine-hydrolyzing) [Streptomyces sp. RKAG337]
MSGIVGWVDYQRNLSGEAPVLRAMADTLNHRGGDGEGQWLSQHAGLAHRRFAVLSPADSRQPVIADHHGEPLAVALLDGSIFNFRTLRTELEGRGHTFRSGGDAEVVARAYLEWGKSFAERLEGAFAVAVWDVLRQELLVVRDRLGIKPVCFARTGPDSTSGFVFGSEPKALLAHPKVEPVVTADGLREVTAHGKKPGTTVFRDITEVRPGHLVRVHSGGVTEERYWGLTAEPHTDSLATTVDTVRGLLSESVGRHLVADVPVAALLSGGIDSSALTALAAGALKAEGRGAIRTFSMNFAGYTENFEVHPTMRATPDSPFATMVAEHVHSDHTEILLDTAALSDPKVHAQVMRSQDTPSPLGDMDVSLYLFFRALRDQAKVVLSGETADEVFNGYFWAYDPKHANSQTFPWVNFERGHDTAVGGLGTALLDRGLRERLDFIGYADGHYREAVAEAPRLAGDSPAERRAREITYLTLTRWAPTHLDRADRMSMAAGVQLRAPFCDHRLVEYVFNVPAEMKRVNGQEKSLLRAAVSDLLPEPVLNRRKSAYPTTQDIEYGRFVHSRFVELAADSSAAVQPLLDQAATKAVLAQDTTPEGAFAWVERANLEMVLQLDTWLTEYGVQLKL